MQGEIKLAILFKKGSSRQCFVYIYELGYDLHNSQAPETPFSIIWNWPIVSCTTDSASSHYSIVRVRESSARTFLSRIWILGLDIWRLENHNFVGYMEPQQVGYMEPRHFISGIWIPETTFPQSLLISGIWSPD